MCGLFLAVIFDMCCFAITFRKYCNNFLSSKTAIDNSIKPKMEKHYLEISRKKSRTEVLDRVKYLKTCVMARELCIIVRTQRAVLEPNDVQDICKYVSALCKEEKECTEPSGLCQKAANAVGSGDEKKYLELCSQSCVKCGQAKRVTQKKEEYVA